MPRPGLTVSLNNAGLGAGQSVTFTLDSASGTATEGSDFSALLAGGLTAATGIGLSTSTGAGGVITVTATNNTGADLASNAALLSFTIASTQDAVVEATENFTVTLASATTAVANPTITTSITDDDTSGITLSGPPSVAEGAATGPYTVSLNNAGLGAGQSVTFTLDSASGTATEGSDFSALLAGGLTAATGIGLSTSTGAGGVIDGDGDQQHRRRPGVECGAVEFYDRQHAGRRGRGDGKLHGDAGQRDDGGGQPNDHHEHYGRRHVGDHAEWSAVGCGRCRDRALHGEPE